MTIRGWLAPCLAAALLVAPAALPAQQSPEEVAQAYFAHFRAGEMDRVVALMHPRALESFRTFMLGIMDDDDLDETPLGNREDLSTMPADSFYLTFMKGAGDVDEFAGVFGSLEVEPLGHVMQGDSLAHVVYSARMAFMNQPAQQTTLITLRRHRGSWLVDPGEGLMSMMGGGLMMLMMNAGMQAGMAGGFGMEDFDVDVEFDSDDEHDHDEDEEDDEDDEDDEDKDDDDPPAA